MVNLRRGAAFVVCAMMLVPIARPARADDTLVLLDGGPGANIYDTLRFVAQSMGYFKQQHVNVDETYTGSSLTAAQLVATGKGDVLASTIEPILEGYEKGLRFQVFFTRSSHYAYVLAVLADSPIRTLADFKGATIGETNVSSSAEVATNSMLAGAGLKRSDYSYLFFKHPILQAGNSVYSALPSTIQAKADVFRRFTRAITEAAVYTHYHPHEVARMYLEGAGLKITDKTLADQEQLLILCKDYIAGSDPSNQRIGSTSLRDTELYSRVLVAAGMATQVVPAAAVVTDQFVGYANAFDRKPLGAR
jgi:ABC-type nitrate/sulfonate/bicarbonate transport system substrate-binding protein